MDELISRQAAIDALEGEIEVIGKANAEAVLKYTKMVCDKIKALPSAQPDLKADYIEAGKIPEQRWIPVTEGLPKPNEKEEDDVQKYYLIQNEFEDMMVAAYRGNDSGYTWWEQMYAYKPIKDKVVAYMPLPKPYERSEG